MSDTHFDESWYAKTQRELGELSSHQAQQQKQLDGITGILQRMERRLDNHGNRLAQLAAWGIAAALVIPMIPDVLVLFRDSKGTGTSSTDIRGMVS